MMRANRRFSFFRSFARRSANAIKKIAELRGGVMLATDFSNSEALCEIDNDICRIVEASQLKSSYQLESRTVVERLNQGHVLYCLVEGAELCSYCWVSRTGSKNDVFFGKRFEIPQAAVYIWDCATFPKYRCRGYYRRLLEYIKRAEPGITQVYVAVDQLNYVSRRGLERAGFSMCFRYWGIRFLQQDGFCIALWHRRLMPLQRAFTRLSHIHDTG